MVMTHSNRTRLILSLLLSCTIAVLSSQAQKGADAPPVTYENVAYGKHPNQVIDFRMAEVEGPAPLVIYIHGGAFRSGSHDAVDGKVVQRYLDAGIHHASVEYRFLPERPQKPVPHEDAVRALQFIRSLADEWGIDRSRIAAYGGSAGAQLVAYLAWAKDFADPESEDPIARESTRLAAVALRGGQSTLNIDWWERNIPGYKRAYHHDRIRNVDLSAVELRGLIHELSPINHISPDDPPTFMRYGMRPDAPVPSDPRRARGWSIHHVNFGVAMEEKLKEVGVEVHLKYPGVELPFDDDVAFLIHHLKK